MQTTLTPEFWRMFFTTLLLAMAVLGLVLVAALERYELHRRRGHRPRASVHALPRERKSSDAERRNAA
ncbi:hypothetical protein H9Y04_25590 [Streptomyces sp. TRM66268-LWL]|uniref:Uncharacterized protein n=1 Tax=Streptomyces polyasparticus TaxID=2767826 RepID=A0ABR7SNN8_9ACTN|nr:hypothetical protein [Streptomyces polyasparticus]MBC9715918.1 hypothetical protein [Streptomyces polyasparticus]